jgi:hypothetical protein
MLRPMIHFCRQPIAAAADLSLCKISSSSERVQDEMAPMYLNRWVNVTLPALCVRSHAEGVAITARCHAGPAARRNRRQSLRLPLSTVL